MNTTRAPLDNADVRKAINLLLNRSDIIDGALFGAAVPGGPLSPALATWAMDTDSFSCYSHDVDAAKTLLSNAGISMPIKLEILVGLHHRHAEDIIKSRNVKIRKDRKTHLTKSEVEWINDCIDDTPYKDKIDHATVLSLINLFRNNKYDSQIDDQPIKSYSDKNMIVEDYQKNKDDYKAFADILKDILYLYDYTNVTGQELWSEKKGTLGSSGISLPYKQKNYEFPMMKKKLDYKFHDAVVYPLLNGLRMYVIFLDGKAKWSKDFDKILNIYKILLPELIKITRDHNKQIGYNVHLLGKSKLLYSIIYKELLMGDMLNQFQ